MRRTRKPKKWSVGPIRVRAVRGPKNGEWYWRAELHRDGESRTLWTGWATRQAAEMRVAALLADGLEQPVKAGSTDRSIETVKDLMEVYVAATEDRQDIKPNTKSIARTSGKHIVRHMSAVLLTRLTMREMESFRDARLKEGAATQTTHHDITILRRAWKWARPLGLCPDHPLPAPKLEVSPTRDKYTPTRDEFWLVLDALEGWPRLMVEILGNTGARVGEGAALRWCDIDFKAGKVRIEQPKKSKKERYRYVPLTAPLESSLKEWGVGHMSSRILPVSFDTARTSITQRWLKPTCERVGVPYFTPHGIRRMVIDQLYESGNDPGTVGKMMGHCEKVALKYYRQARHSDMERAVRLAALGQRGNSNLIKLEDRLRKNA